MPTRPPTKFKIRSLTASTSDIFYSFFLQKYIRLLFEKKLGCLIQQGYQEIVISELVQKSEGLILYA